MRIQTAAGGARVAIVILRFMAVCTEPTEIPSSLPSTTSQVPSGMPSIFPSSMPSTVPSSMPSTVPSTMPSMPSGSPSTVSSFSPSDVPSEVPSPRLSGGPSETRSPPPSEGPYSSPLTTTEPTQDPTTQVPTTSPTMTPLPPTASPTIEPTTLSPSSEPSSAATQPPTTGPTSIPTQNPTTMPVTMPPTMHSPTTLPPTTQSPTTLPPVQQTTPPTTSPTDMVTTYMPSSSPSSMPSPIPSGIPSTMPSSDPSEVNNGLVTLTVDSANKIYTVVACQCDAGPSYTCVPSSLSTLGSNLSICLEAVTEEEEVEFVSIQSMKLIQDSSPGIGGSSWVPILDHAMNEDLTSVTLLGNKANIVIQLPSMFFTHSNVTNIHAEGVAVLKVVSEDSSGGGGRARHLKDNIFDLVAVSFSFDESNGTDSIFLDDYVVEFSDESISSEILINYNISLVSNQTVGIYEQDCSTVVDSSIVGVTTNLTSTSPSHGSLAVIIDINQDAVVGSAIWTDGDTVGVGYIRFCVRVDLFPDDVTEPTKSLDTIVSINLTTTQGFGNPSGFVADPLDTVTVAAETGVDYNMVACQCVACQTCDSDPLDQFSPLSVCLEVNASNVEIAAIRSLRIIQDGTSLTWDPIVSGDLNPDLTVVSILGRTACVRTQLPSKFFETLVFGEPLGGLNVRGVAVLAFSGARSLSAFEDTIDRDSQDSHERDRNAGFEVKVSLVAAPPNRSGAMGMHGAAMSLIAIMIGSALSFLI